MQEASLLATGGGKLARSQLPSQNLDQSYSPGLRVLLGLLGESHIELPTYPGFDTNAWVTTQTEKLQKLLRQGKKNNWALSHQGAMDNAETLPMTFENVEARYT